MESAGPGAGGVVLRVDIAQRIQPLMTQFRCRLNAAKLQLAFLGRAFRRGPPSLNISVAARTGGAGNELCVGAFAVEGADCAAAGVAELAGEATPIRMSAAPPPEP